MHEEGQRGERPDPPGIVEHSGERDQRGGAHVEAERDQHCPLAEEARRGAHTDQRVVLAVLQGVDGVVGDGPEDEAEIEDVDGAGDDAGGRGADEDTPVEGQAEPGLRPPGHALGEGVDSDQRQGEQGGDLRVARQQEPDPKADTQLDQEEGVGLLQGHRAGRDWPEGGARDLGVKVPVGDVVPGAAGAAHNGRADQEQGGPGKVGEEQAAGEALEGEANDAGQEQQPDAHRPVEPRQHGIRPPSSRQAFEPAGKGGISRIAEGFRFVVAGRLAHHDGI